MKKIVEGAYVLGIRLGVSSLGWSVLTLDEKNKPVSVLALGVRKFPVGAAGDVASGRESGHNQRRQEARGTRVRLARRVARLRALWALLQAAGLLPAGRFKERDVIIKRLDGAIDKHPYALRARALDAPLTAHELGRAIYHLAQRRGFQSNRRAPVKDAEELGVVKQGIVDLEDAMKTAGARTLGEYLAKLPNVPLRRRWTARNMLREEFAAIATAQKPYHAALTEKFVAQLAQVLFTQRALKSQSHKIGRCDLEPHRRRAQIAGLDAQEFRVLCRVNDLRLVDDVGAVDVELTGTQRMALLKLLEDGDATFPATRKALGLAKTVRFNAERIDDERLIGFRTSARLKTALGDAWAALTPEKQNVLVEDLCNIDDDAGLRRRLLSTWGFDEKTVERLLSTTLEPGCAALSHKAIATLLPRLRAGVAYATARKEYYPRADHHDEADRLPLIQEAYPHLSNPLVRRALSELRVVVNALVAKHGRPRSIRVSLMRELRLGQKARERASMAMRARNRQRAQTAARILTDLGVQEPPRWMVDKVLLADECGWTCPFTGRVINMRSLVGGEPQFEMAHIIPFHQSLDDAFENKTLCHVSALTGNRCVEPKALRQVDTLGRFEKFVGPFAKEKLQRIKLTVEEIAIECTETILASRFIDTCYASRLACDLLSKLYPSSRAAVTATRGPITGYVKEGCGLNRLDLPAGDHRRAAVDASAVALCGQTVTRRLTAAALGALPGRRRLDPGQVLPWPGFAADVQRFVENMVVSARVRKKLSGPLHEETFYRREGEEKGKTVYSVRKHLWQITPTDVAQIVGSEVRAVVAAKLVELKESDPRKAFAKTENLPMFRAHVVRRVRIRRGDELFTVGRGPHARHVATERNHHAAVYMRAGRGGKTIADRAVVSQFEAQRRLVTRAPLVQWPPDVVPCEGLRTIAVLETLDCRALQAGFRTIRCVSKDPSIVLTAIEDGRTLAEIGADKKMLRMSVEQLRLKGARKVVVLPLGEVRTDNT